MAIASHQRIQVRFDESLVLRLREHIFIDDGYRLQGSFQIDLLSFDQTFLVGDHFRPIASGDSDEHPIGKVKEYEEYRGKYRQSEKRSELSRRQANEERNHSEV